MLTDAEDVVQSALTKYQMLYFFTHLVSMSLTVDQYLPIKLLVMADYVNFCTNKVFHQSVYFLNA